MYDLLVTSGTLVTGTGSRDGSLAIKDGRIAGVIEPGKPVEASKTIDAAGKLVIPGAIDAHVHVYTPYSPAADTIESASVAAAHGGLTTMFFYIGAVRGARQIPGTIYRAIDASGLRLDEFFPPIIAEGQKTSKIDFGIHCLTPPDRGIIDQIPAAARLGIRTFKFMLGYHPARGWGFDDRLLTIALEKIAGSGGLAMFHCENGNTIGATEDQLYRQGKYDADHFLQSRPSTSEAETVRRVARLCHDTQCPIYIVHLSSKEGLDEVRRARDAGWDITIETCPQYLLLTDEDTRRQRVLLKMAPPLRTKADNEALWDGIRQGYIDICASDHAPWEMSEKLQAKDFMEAPFGAPGVETILPLMYSEGVAKGRIIANRLVQLMCENPAKRLGVYPEKGSLGIGADADLTIIDPGAKWTVSSTNLHSRAGYTGYEGRSVIGKPVVSLRQGKVLLRDSHLEYTQPAVFMATKPV
ncbi:MAG: amidohydrolase family protein [Chloroflexota bacterium]